MITMAGIKAVPTHSMLAGAVLLLVAVLEGSTVLGSKADGAAPATNTCTSSAGGGGISVSVDAETKSVSFVCATEVSKVQPGSTESENVTQCYMNSDPSVVKRLEDLFGIGSQAIVTPTGDPKAGSKVALTLGKLPQRTTAIYFECKAATDAPVGSNPGVGGVGGVRAQAGAKEPEAKCLVTVTVPADPAAHTCTVDKGNLELEITSESKRVSFHCDTNVATLSPEEFSDKIFDESCEKEVTLSEKLPTAMVSQGSSGYSLIVDELPETAATFCYKCSAASAPTQKGASGQSQNANACTVKVKVAAANFASGSFSSVTTGSVPTLILGLAASLVFAAVAF
ncbi:SRS domain-containing protein [Neospora caninum Liverpool]|uniref:SRS domain-containing protein n=1 Tax=Neospora caninum (strain Liverpool) TaxID=572307 RepID=F0VNT7_NEOCL|nr:SRS domain-containing protein [Neospora caninum Liverpool]CBZ55383.1 SRS domain-containing protein [Neospora caninum Liverpool]|eukprot:XP_003885411.1 SRS domain-containing protein [Neospora caninum Liverpool]